MFNNDYSVKEFLTNISNSTLVKKDDIKDDIRQMELIKACSEYCNKVDSDKLSSVTMDEIDELYDFIYNISTYDFNENHPITKMLLTEQSKYNLMNLKSLQTVDDLDFF